MKKTQQTTQSLMAANAERAEAMLKQLANAKRLLILCSLVEREHSVSDLCKIVGLSQSSLSQHLAKMREAGLVIANKRGLMVYYRVASVEVQAILATLHLVFCRTDT